MKNTDKRFNVRHTVPVLKYKVYLETKTVSTYLIAEELKRNSKPDETR